MDLDKYRELYLSESREHLSRMRGLLEGLLKGAGAESVHDLFRHAHSLKGMAASMGFTATGDLAHSLEGLFDLWRKGTGPLPAQVEAALRASDALDALLDAVRDAASDEPAAPGAAAATRGLQALLAPGTRGAGPTAAPAASGIPPPAAAPPPPAAPAPSPVRLSVSIDGASALPAARILVVAQKVRELYPSAPMDPDLVTLQKTNGRQVQFLLPEDPRVRDLARTVESLPEVAAVSVHRPAGGERPPETSLVRDLRVPARDLDALLVQTSDLLYGLNQFEAGLGEAGRRTHRLWLDAHRARLGRLYDQVLTIRLVPFEPLVEHLQRTVRELGDRLGKRARLEASGADEKLDRSLLERLRDPLLHLVRNALDHGIEGAAERADAGKPADGTLRIEVRRDAEALLVTLSDDGRGINAEAIRQAAVDQGILSAQESALLDEARLFDLLTLPSFSTRREVTEVSGRGVGLDVVRTAVESLGGHLEIRSTPGRGSVFTLVIPSAVALTRVLVFAWDRGGARFCLPASQVSQIYPLSSYALTWSGSRQLLVDGESLLPVLPWRLGPVGRDGFGLRLTLEGTDRVLLVGEVSQMERVVIQPLGPPLDMVPEWMGGALLATGEVAYVLDGRVVARRSEEEDHAG
jgi:two-component system chemotaxis sensor kinase CheA